MERVGVVGLALRHSLPRAWWFQFIKTGLCVSFVCLGGLSRHLLGLTQRASCMNVPPPWVGLCLRDIVDSGAVVLLGGTKERRKLIQAHHKSTQQKQQKHSSTKPTPGLLWQVYYNLSELQPAVRELQARYVHQMSVAMGAALDPAKISAVSAAAGAAAAAGGGAGGGRNAVAAGGAARWQQALWTQLAACLDAVHGPVVALWHLQRVLAKKRDPFTHVCFLDLLLDAEEEAAAAGDGDREGEFPAIDPASPPALTLPPLTSTAVKAALPSLSSRVPHTAAALIIVSAAQTRR